MIASVRPCCINPLAKLPKVFRINGARRFDDSLLSGSCWNPLSVRLTNTLMAGIARTRGLLSRAVDATRRRGAANQKLDEIAEEDWIQSSEASLEAQVIGAEVVSPTASSSMHISRAAIDAAEGTQTDAAGVLSIHNLAKAYKSRKVVEDVSLHVRRGEAVGLLGPNGAGKTTVFYMITGLVKPDKGIISLDGYDVTPLPMYRRVWA